MFLLVRYSGLDCEGPEYLSKFLGPPNYQWFVDFNRSINLRTQKDNLNYLFFFLFYKVVLIEIFFFLREMESLSRLQFGFQLLNVLFKFLNNLIKFVPPYTPDGHKTLKHG